MGVNLGLSLSLFNGSLPYESAGWGLQRSIVFFRVIGDRVDKLSIEH